MRHNELNTGAEHLGENPENINSNIDSVYKNFIEIYKVSHDTLVQLTSFTSQKERISLQESLSHLDIQKDDKETLAQLSESDFNQLLSELRELKQQRLSLLDEVGKNNTRIENTEICDTSTLEKTFGIKRIQNAMNPKNILDHIDGGVMGIGNACINTTKVALNIGKGIVYTPRDLYLLWKGEAELPEYNV